MIHGVILCSMDNGKGKGTRKNFIPSEEIPECVCGEEGSLIAHMNKEKNCSVLSPFPFCDTSGIGDWP